MQVTAWWPEFSKILNLGYLGYLGPLVLSEQKQGWWLGVLRVQDTPQGTEPTPGWHTGTAALPSSYTQVVPQSRQTTVLSV